MYQEKIAFLEKTHELFRGNFEGKVKENAELLKKQAQQTKTITALEISVSRLS